MKIAIGSGKGGTGKTTFALNLAYAAAELEDNVRLLDCDVEAPDCNLFLSREPEVTKDVTVKVPKVDATKCTGCGICGKECRYNALAVVKNNVMIFQELCHSCGVCVNVCPEGAFTEVDRPVGIVERSDNTEPFGFARGLLNIGEVLTTRVIDAVKECCDPEGLNIIDCPPGTSCPAVEAFSGSDVVILVTEPTPFGLSDLQLAVNLTVRLGLASGIVINKSDGVDKIITDYAERAGVPVIGRIPFKREYAEAYSEGKILVEEFPELKSGFVDMLRAAGKLTAIAQLEPERISMTSGYGDLKPGSAATHKELTVLSGKGGTGKTTVSSAFAELADDKVMVDADVDAANLHLLMNSLTVSEKDFSGGKRAVINYDTCIGCGACAEACRFGGIICSGDGRCEVSDLTCEGCGLCEHICPVNAISSDDKHTGKLRRSVGKAGPLVHARLANGEDNSGKLVAQVRKLAAQTADELKYPLLLTDGPPGAGCPVIASITGSDAIVIVTEPTVSGLHDLGRIVALIKHFGLGARVIINKADLNPDKAGEIKAFAADQGVDVIADIPFDENVVKALKAGKGALSVEGPVADSIRAAWETVSKTLLD